jgi:hypothetical protein
MTRIAQCDVCYWIDADERQKPALYCRSCQAWICDSCIGRPWRRAIAMFLRKINFRLRSAGPLPILIVILMLAPFAHSQSTCGAGLQNLSSLNAVSNIGKVYQNACWDPVGLALTFPNFSGGGGSANTLISPTTLANTATFQPTTGTSLTIQVPSADFLTLNGGTQFEATDAAGDLLVLGGGLIEYLDSAGNGLNEPLSGQGTLVFSTNLSLQGGTGVINLTNAGAALPNTTTGTLTATGLIKGTQLQSTVATGTAPLIVASTTNVANLNASSLSGATFAAPGTIGGTTPGIINDRAENCGIAGTIGCVITGAGATSGTATITWPAVAGTSGNAVAFSNSIAVPSGSSTNTAICNDAGGTTCPQPNTGFVLSNPGFFWYSQGVAGLEFSTQTNGGMILAAAIPFGFSSSTPDVAFEDTELSRVSAGILGVGTSHTVGDTTGKLEAAGYVSVGTTFTLSANACTATGLTGGATAGKMTSGATGACTFTVTMGNTATAPNGWACKANDLTTPADLINETATTATTAGFVGTTVTGDAINFFCEGY